MFSYKVLIILTFTINISHVYTYTKEEYQNEIDICVECLEKVGFTRDLGFINYFIAMEYASGSAVVSFDTKKKILLEDTLNKKIENQDYHSLMDKQMLIDHVDLYYDECIFFKPEPIVFSIWYYCRKIIVDKKGFCGTVMYLPRLLMCEWVIKKRFYNNTHSDIIYSFDYATGYNNTPSSSKKNTKSKTWQSITESKSWKDVVMESKKSIDTSKSNTSQEADIYYQYLLRVIIQKALEYDIFLPKNWCELNIPKLMDLLDLKSTTESNKTIEVNHI